MVSTLGLYVTSFEKFVRNVLSQLVWGFHVLMWVPVNNFAILGYLIACHSKNHSSEVHASNVLSDCQSRLSF